MARFSFHRSDGREFCLAINGESIGHRILAIGATSITQADWKRLRGTVAVIVEAADDLSDPGAASEFDPLVYCDGDEVARAWRDLHALSGKTIDADTAQRLSEVGFFVEADLCDEED
jgi:hypothetical protein